MTKKFLSSLGVLLALCWTFNVSAQTLLFDAAGSGTTFSKVGGALDCVIELNGNTVSNGVITMTAEAKAVKLILPSVIPDVAGISIVAKISNVDVTKGGQLMAIHDNQSPNANSGGIKLKNGTTDGTMIPTWRDAEWATGGNSILNLPTDKSQFVISNTYNREATACIFYLNGAICFQSDALKSTGGISEIFFGGISDVNSNFLNEGMKIERVQIYQGKLTPAQVIAAEASIKAPFSNDPLSLAIASAKLVHGSAVESPNPGRYSKENMDIFKAAIEAAEAVLAANPDAATANEAIATLNAAKTTFIASRNQIKLSAEGNDTWYYITGVINYAAGKAIVASGTTDGSNYNFTDKTLNPTKLFKFEDAGDGKVAIKNMGSNLYIKGDGKAGTAAAAFNATFLGEDGQYTFNVQGAQPLHAQNNGSLLVTWAGGLNSGSAWRLEELSAEDVSKPVSIASVEVGQGFVVTGKGNVDHPLMYANVSVDGLVGTATTKGMKLDFSESNHLASITKVKIYKMPMGDKRLKVANATLIGEADVAGNEVQINFTTDQSLVAGINRFGIAVDIADDAVEGKTIKAKVVDITLGDDTKKVTDVSPAHACTIFLTQSLVIAPGDYNSVSYRIPAIAVANDGTLVVVTDKRKNHSGDLSADIDLTVQRSSDNGKTWSEPIVIAGADTNLGYGDAAIVKDKESGKLMVVCVNDKGFFGSTPTAPIRLIYFESTDNGLTWSAPRDITDQIWGAGCSNPITAAWNGMFPASGRMLQLRSGRIMSAMLVRNPVSGSNDNFVMYTDDLGATWHPSTSMIVKGGDEAKLTQRNDGKVIISSRQGGGRVWNVSNDDTGILWTQANQRKRPELFDQNCNGEIMTYTSTLDGYNKNRMLHSLCWNSGSRQNVSMILSYDEGETWGNRKTICAPSSAYSTFEILPDGTIGMYYEDGTHGGEAYEMVFVRFSIDWLTDGADTFVPAVNSVEKNPSTNIKVAVENDKIVVYGTDELPRIFSATGVELSRNAKLTSGVYLVKVAGQTAKVAVK